MDGVAYVALCMVHMAWCLAFMVHRFGVRSVWSGLVWSDLVWRVGFWVWVFRGMAGLGWEEAGRYIFHLPDLPVMKGMWWGVNEDMCISIHVPPVSRRLIIYVVYDLVLMRRSL